MVLEVLDGKPSDPRLEGLAQAAPELCNTSESADFTLLFARLGSDGKSSHFGELTLVSPDYVHVIERLRDRPNVALVALGPGDFHLGLVLSGIRRKLMELEAV
jgi:hypothetical protein